MSALKEIVGDFWQRQFGRKPWIFRDRHGLAYLMDGKATKPKCFSTGLATANGALLTYIEHTVKPGMTVLDLSPGLGAMSLLAGKLLGEGGQVMAFAPEPSAYRILVNNVALNRLTARVAVIGKDVLPGGNTPHAEALSLDHFSATWHWPHVSLLHLSELTKLHAMMQSAAILFQNGRIDRVILEDVPLNQRELLQPLTNAGLRLHQLTASGALQVLDMGTIHDAAPATVVALRAGVTS